MIYKIYTFNLNKLFELLQKKIRRHSVSIRMAYQDYCKTDRINKIYSYQVVTDSASFLGALNTRMSVSLLRR